MEVIYRVVQYRDSPSRNQEISIMEILSTMVRGNYVLNRSGGGSKLCG